MNSVVKNICRTICLAILVLTSACEKETVEDRFLSISEEDRAVLQQPFLHEAANRQIPISTNLPVVKATSSAEWCTPSIVAHQGTHLRIEVYPHDGFEERTAEITVFGQGIPSIVVPIRQLGSQPALVVAEMEGIAIIDDELDFTLHITSNIEFTMEIPEWIENAGDNSPYVGSKVYTFIASPIPPGDRAGEIKILSEEHPELNVTVPVSQLQNVLHPELTDFLPSSGEKGETIVLNGRNFGTNLDLVSVHFNALEAEVLSVSDNAIEVAVPRAPGNSCTITVDIAGETLVYAALFEYIPSWGLYTVTGDGDANFRGGTLAEGRVKARYISLDDNGNLFASHRDQNPRHIVRINEAEDIVESVASTGRLNPNGSTVGAGNIVYVANDLYNSTSYFELNPSNNWTPVEKTIIYPEGEAPPSGSYWYRIIYNPHDGHLYGFIGHAEGHMVKINPVPPHPSEPNKVEGRVIYKHGAHPYWYGATIDPRRPYLYISVNSAGLGYGPYQMDLNHLSNGFTRLNSAGANGSATPAQLNDGSLATAGFGQAWDLEFGPDGHLYVSDNTNHVIRKVNLSTKTVETVVGVAGQAGTTDGKKDTARLSNPRGLAWSKDGKTLYISDWGSSRIRKWTLD